MSTQRHFRWQGLLAIELKLSAHVMYRHSPESSSFGLAPMQADDTFLRPVEKFLSYVCTAATRAVGRVAASAAAFSADKGAGDVKAAKSWQEQAEQNDIQEVRETMATLASFLHLLQRSASNSGYDPAMQYAQCCPPSGARAASESLSSLTSENSKGPSEQYRLNENKKMLPLP